MSKSPIQHAKDKGGKEKLIAAVKSLATDDLFLNASKASEVLDRVSNAKLIRLERILSEVKKSFGSRSALIDAIAKAEKREKDAGYKTHLEAKSTPELYEKFSAHSRREKLAQHRAKN